MNIVWRIGIFITDRIPTMWAARLFGHCVQRNEAHLRKVNE